MKALRKDFYVQIKRTLNRFISILLIVALGVAFYVGIRSAETDMRLSADKDYDEGRMMDIRIVSTLGLTDDDVQAIQRVDRIQEAIGTYSVDSLIVKDTQEMAVTFLAYSEKINVPRIQSGTFSGGANECMVDAQLAGRHGLEVGDKITVDNESIGESEFIVTGIFTLANYLSLQKGSTTVGTGTLDGLVIISESAFDMECYTDIYALVEGAAELNSYDDEYQDLLDSVTRDIEDNIADARGEARYNGIVDEANEELESARREYESGKTEYESGMRELESGKTEIVEKESELESAKIKVADSEKELESASKEYESGVRELESGKAQLAESEKKYNDGVKAYESGFGEYESGVTELNAGKKEYESGMEEYESGLAEYNNGVQEYESGLAEYNKGNTEYESGLAEYNSAKEQYDAAVKIYGEEALAATKIKLDNTYVVLSATKSQLDSAKTQLEQSSAKLETVKTTLHASKKKLKKAKTTIDRSEEKLKKAKTTLDQTSKQLKNAKRQIENAKKEIKENERKLAEAEKTILSGQSELEDAKKEIADGEKALAKAKKKIRKSEKKLADAKVELADAEKQISDAEKDIADIEKAEWFVLDRNYVRTFVEYGSDAERIGKIGAVFPIIFFIVAAMVSLTTMTRMVEEERTQIGTLKALGYSKLQIAFKYIAYGALATLIGGFIGGYAGGTIFPYIIIVAYRILYANQYSVCVPTNPQQFVIAIVAAFVSVVGATLLACINELRTVPAELMRPEAPKSGKRVMLERIPFIWKRLSFNMKSTFRNLFRYKKRLIMTLFGIGGCTALLLVGFGIRNSVHSILSLQYGVVNKYDVTISYEENETEKNHAENAHVLYAEDDRVKAYMDAMVFTADVGKGSDTVNVNIIIPENPDELEQFISLHNRVDGEKYKLGDHGVIITEKMASLLEAEVGDTIYIKEGETKKYEVKVDAIAETYANHYLYMTKNLYDTLYDDKYRITTAYVNLAENVDTNTLSKELMDCEDISGVSITEEIRDTFAKSLRGMDSIVFVLIISAGGLAFIVLYNLNNINIAERKRELATLKVLGFYDIEVSGYIYRENIIITVMGIALGILFGIGLHKFVITTAEIDIMMFGRNIGVSGYMLSIILTILFAALINMSMHFKLKKVDMATSLKSVE